MSFDFDFDQAYENSRSLRRSSQDTGIFEETTDDYFDDYYSEEDYDSDEEWMEQFRLQKASSDENQTYNIGLDESRRRELIQEGKEVYVDFFQRLGAYQSTYFRSARVTPAPVDFFPFDGEEQRVQQEAQDSFDPDEEEGLSSLDEKVYSFKKDSILKQTVKILEDIYDKDPNNQEEKHLFRFYYTTFLNEFAGWKYKYNRLDFYKNLNNIRNNQDKQLILNILNYEEKPSQPINNIFIIYVTSGGGKTTLYKKYKNFIKILDVDEFIKDNYESFLNFQAYIEKLDHRKTNGIMNLWFKYHLDKMNRSGLLSNSLLLFNHPNQLPIHFRKRINEIILIPTQLKWNLRFFPENYFSLIHVKNKHKAIVRYDDYLYYSLSFFRRHYTHLQLSKITKKPIYGLQPEDYPQDEDNQQQQRKHTGRRPAASGKKRNYNLRERKKL